jgi:nuclear pore complex protein Nup98-Nup96
MAHRRTVRPCWGPDGTLIYSTLDNAPPTDAGLTVAVGEEQQLLKVVRLVQPDSTLALSEVLDAHLKLQPMQLVNGVPTTTPQAAGSIKAYFDASSEGANSQYEKTIWEVASILFDELPGGTNTRAMDEHQGRRAKLSAFWEKLVEKDTDEAVAAAQLSEEKAIAALAGHRVTAACKYLLEGKNFRLATLVSLIGTSAAAKEDIQHQIESWKGSNAIAEMSDAIRALYGLLAGEVGFCAGKSKNDAPVEDRANSFVISQRFGLSWKQAFGLRLWYGTYPGDNIADAVDMYDKDVAIGREHKPKPWYIQQGIANSWPADRGAGGEDELWALLKLYASRGAGLGDVLAQRNISLGPWDTRLAWQLGRALLDTGRFTLLRQQSDAASLAFAEQLTAEGHWILAIWVLSHLSGANLRGKIIQDQLARHAGHLIQNPAAWKELRSHPWLPLPLAYEGLALWSRSVEQDGVMELDFLRKAGNYREAHRALVTKVGPQAIIERDWDLLWMAEALKGHVVEIPEWGLGGAVYALYRQFRMGLKGLGKGHAGGGGVRVDVVEKLLALLKEVKKGDARMQVEQRAAVQLMTSQLREVLQDVVRV